MFFFSILRASLKEQNQMKMLKKELYTYTYYVDTTLAPYRPVYKLYLVVTSLKQKSCRSADGTNYQI